MLKRLIVGFILGLVMGSLVAAVAIKGLGVMTLSAVLAYLFAAVTGVVTGLVTGKPIWAAGGQIEAGLKAAFGALLSVGMMYAMRRWVHVDVDLGDAVAAYAGRGSLSELPAFTLPLIAAVLGAFYSADNTPSESEGSAPSKGKGSSVSGKKALSGKKVRVEQGEDDELDLESDVGAKRAKR